MAGKGQAGLKKGDYPGVSRRKAARTHPGQSMETAARWAAEDQSLSRKGSSRSVKSTLGKAARIASRAADVALVAAPLAFAGLTAYTMSKERKARERSGLEPKTPKFTRLPGRLRPPGGWGGGGM